MGPRPVERDRAAHGITDRDLLGQGKADRWSLTDFARDLYQAVQTRKVVESAERER